MRNPTVTTAIIITEQCGARWTATTTGRDGIRAFWVLLVSGKSQAKPGVLGFYVAGIDAAAEALAN
jgi:hypothetical protein